MAVIILDVTLVEYHNSWGYKYLVKRDNGDIYDTYEDYLSQFEPEEKEEYQAQITNLLQYKVQVK